MNFKDWLKLAKEGLPNIDKIAEGYINNIKEKNNLLSEEEVEEIVKRKLICEQCPLFSLNAFKDDTEYQNLFKKPFTSAYKNREGERFCGSCGCPEKLRIYSLNSNCGLSSYNEKHPNNKQPLKWEAFKPKQ